MELSPITTSPKILEVFVEAKKAVLASFDKKDSSAIPANGGKTKEK
jgi:hypothetical protein